MKTLPIYCVLGLVLLFINTAHSQPQLLLQTNAANLIVGTPFTLTLRVVGLNPNGVDTVRGFHVILPFDNTLLRFDDLVLSDAFGQPDSNPGDNIADSQESAGVLVVTPAEITLVQVSALSFDQLNTLQDESIVLATVQFTPLARGQTTLILSKADIVDAFAFDLDTEVMTRSLLVGESNILIIDNFDG